MKTPNIYEYTTTINDGLGEPSYSSHRTDNSFGCGAGEEQMASDVRFL